MPTLAEKLLTPTLRPRAVTECTHLVDEEVASKGGLSGIAIKGAYAVVKAVKAGIIPEVIDSLLEDFVSRLEPFYADWQKSPTVNFGAALAKRSGEVADALLASTDQRAQASKNATLRKAYEKLRPMGKKQVELAIPRLGRKLDGLLA